MPPPEVYEHAAHGNNGTLDRCRIEEALVTALWLNGESTLDDAPRVRPDSFSDPFRREAWRCGMGLRSDGKQVDISSLPKRMAKTSLPMSELEITDTLNASGYALRQSDDVAALGITLEALNDEPPAPGRPMCPRDSVNKWLLENAPGVEQAAERVAAEYEAATPRPYTVRAWGDVATVTLPPRTPFWGDVFSLGIGRPRLHVILGIGGLGKSRLALNVARNQALQIPFAGMPTGPRPLRHLLMGSENGIERLQFDVSRMSVAASPDALERLSEHVHMTTLEQPSDTFMTLGDLANESRWRATIEQVRPDVLWDDPWGDVQAGDPNSDADTRSSIGTLLRILAEVNADSALVVLHHARTGAANIAQAVGYDAANFGKNSKALYSAARAVLNMAPGGEGEQPPVVLVFAKSNDAPRPPTVALELDPETMLYHVAEDFDADAWIEDVRHRASRRGRPPSRPRLTAEDALRVLGDEVGTAAVVRRRLRDAGATRDDADDLVKRLTAEGVLESWSPSMRNAPKYVGDPSAIERFRGAWNDGKSTPEDDSR